MTELLSKAIDKTSLLSENLQNQLASEIIDEIEYEVKWDKSFADSQDLLEIMADTGIKQFKMKERENIGFDKL